MKAHGDKKIEAYRFFVNQFRENKHQEIINNVKLFLNSDKKNYFLKGPE